MRVTAMRINYELDALKYLQESKNIERRDEEDDQYYDDDDEVYIKNLREEFID